jgi:hypothetical protein
MRRLFFSILILIAGAMTAGEQDRESRIHYVIADRGHTPLYHITAIEKPGEDESAQTFLIRDAAGQQVRIQVERDYQKHTTIAEYSLDDRRSIKVTLDLPSKSTTRSGFRAEVKANPNLGNADVPVIVESTGRNTRTSEKEWKDLSKKSAARSRVKAVLDGNVSATVKNLLPVLAFPMFRGACSSVPFVTEGEECVGDEAMLVAVVAPDCSFDAKFGFPCSPAQQQRASAPPGRSKNGSY